MSNFNDIARFYKIYYGNDEGKSEIKNKYPDKGLAYTCNCGWIDAGHADGGGASKLWRNVLNEADKYKQGGIEGYKVRYAQHAAAWGTTFDNAGDYFVKNDLSETEKQRVALAIFQEVSLGFETVQNSGFTGFVSETLGSGSSFSEEDLVSNLVGFYYAVKGLRWQDQCGIVSREASEKIWNTDGAVGLAKNKNNSFSPKFHQCDECTGIPTFPHFYTSIQPIEKGILHFDFDEVFAVQGLNEHWTPYPLDALRNRFGFHDGDFDFSASRGNFGLGFISVPTKVRIDFKVGESQYFFARRALMIAAFNAGLNFIEQVDFVEKFYPINNSFENMSKFSMDWTKGDPSDDKDKTIKQNEFIKETLQTFLSFCRKNRLQNS